MILRLAFALFVIGICLQITAYKKKDFELLRVGFALCAGPSVVNGILFLQIPHFYINIVGFFLLVLTWLNWIIVQKLERNDNFRNGHNSKMIAIVRVVGAKNNLAEYFNYYGEQMPELVPEGDGRYSCTHKMHLDRLPVVKVLKGFVLDINPEEGKPGRWQLRFGTEFGTKESHVFDVINIFIRYEDPKEIYHHFDFEAGKVLIHIVDFHPIGWKFAG